MLYRASPQGHKSQGSASPHLHYSCPYKAGAFHCTSQDIPEEVTAGKSTSAALLATGSRLPASPSPSMLLPSLPTPGPSQALQCQRDHPLGSPASGKTAVCQIATPAHTLPPHCIGTNTPARLRKLVGILPTPVSQGKMSPRGGSTLKFRVIDLPWVRRREEYCKQIFNTS